MGKGRGDWRVRRLEVLIKGGWTYVVSVGTVKGGGKAFCCCMDEVDGWEIQMRDGHVFYGYGPDCSDPIFCSLCSIHTQRPDVWISK